jgi:hypothetical protein
MSDHSGGQAETLEPKPFQAGLARRVMTLLVAAVGLLCLVPLASLTILDWRNSGISTLLGGLPCRHGLFRSPSSASGATRGFPFSCSGSLSLVERVGERVRLPENTATARRSVPATIAAQFPPPRKPAVCSLKSLRAPADGTRRVPATPTAFSATTPLPTTKFAPLKSGHRFRYGASGRFLCCAERERAKVKTGGMGATGNRPGIVRRGKMMSARTKKY